MTTSTVAAAEVATAVAFQYGLGRLPAAAVTDHPQPRGTPETDALRVPVVPLPR